MPEAVTVTSWPNLRVTVKAGRGMVTAAGTGGARVRWMGVRARMLGGGGGGLVAPQFNTHAHSPSVGPPSSVIVMLGKADSTASSVGPDTVRGSDCRGSQAVQAMLAVHSRQQAAAVQQAVRRQAAAAGPGTLVQAPFQSLHAPT